MRSPSSMTTSGAPLPAETAVWNLSYSSPPAPALFQQTCTSSCALLKLSTTSSMFGYQAHMVTMGASALTIVFVQVASLFPPPPPPPVPPSEHATRAPATTRVATEAIAFFVFINRFLSGDISVGAVCRTPACRRRQEPSEHHCRGTFPTLYFQRCRRLWSSHLRMSRRFCEPQPSTSG